MISIKKPQNYRLPGGNGDGGDADDGSVEKKPE